MSDTPIDSAADPAAPSTPVAPSAANGTSETPGSTPASGDATASDAAASEEARQSRSESRRQANQRREIRELHREIGYMRARLEASQGSPAQADQGQPTGERRSAPDVSTMRQAAKAQLVMERLEDAGDDIEGFDAVLKKITAPDFPVTEAVVDFLAEASPAVAARTVAWLVEHPEEARRVSMMSEWRADRFLEKVAASLGGDAKSSPRTTNTPPPPPTVNGRGTPQISLESASMEDFVKLRNEQRAKAGYK